MVNGAPFRGADGLAGELGHTSINIDGPKCKCGNRGMLGVIRFKDNAHGKYQSKDYFRRGGIS